MIDVLLDSGAFTAYTQKTTVDIDEYIKFVKQYEKYLSGYITLDVIGNAEASYENWEYMRSKGTNPIPVYHMRAPVEYLHRYVAQTDYIALGGVASRKTAKALRADFDRLWTNHLLDANRMPLVKVHAMGITDVPTMVAFPWFSIDSSTWLVGRKRGLLLTPYMSKSAEVYTRTPIRIDISPRSPDRFKTKLHLETMDKEDKGYIKVKRYIDAAGIPMGVAETVGEYGKPVLNEDGKEILIEDGLCTNYKLRDAFNQLYFMELERVLPDWPWQWTANSRQLFFEETSQENLTPSFPLARTKIYLAGGGVHEPTNYKVACKHNFPYRRMLSFIDMKDTDKKDEDTKEVSKETSKNMRELIELIKGGVDGTKKSRVRRRIIKSKDRGGDG